ncbi:Wzz/FepE/Etk N-terminal domain-containing protein [Roseovarius sp. MBR-6]|jgi:uncharacterized protein involved in exopolysaccharide biosynthesis|uniref:Wzz/FepE/Etk N-terminal domain-containing protein n=1 Tax=Roseovarius sp. MBR-6 TaxID=3156459 RepID=UPI0033948767
MSSITSVSGILRLLRRRLWLILVVTLVGCVLSVAFALSRPHVFQATAVIQIETPQVDPSTSAQLVATDARLRLQLIEQRLMARDHVIAMIEKHGLFANNPDWPLDEKVFRLRSSARIEPITVGVPGYAPQAATPSGLRVTVALDNPDKAAAVANDFVAAVLAQNRERRLASVRETLSFFTTEEARVNSDIAALEARIVEFKRANAEALPEAIASQRLELASLRETLLSIQREIVTLETQISRQRQEVFARQVEQLSEQRDLVTARMTEIEQAIAAAPRVERELGALDRDLTQLQDQLGTITRARVEAEMASVLENRQQQERFEVLETAVPPVTPISASRKKLAAAGGVASLLLAVGLALALEILNPKLRTATQMQDELDIIPVVTIPVVRLRHERRARALRIAATVIAALLVLPLLVRLVQDRLPALRLPATN